MQSETNSLIPMSLLERAVVDSYLGSLPSIAIMAELSDERMRCGDQLCGDTLYTYHQICALVRSYTVSGDLTEWKFFKFGPSYVVRPVGSDIVMNCRVCHSLEKFRGECKLCGTDMIYEDVSMAVGIVVPLNLQFAQLLLSRGSLSVRLSVDGYYYLQKTVNFVLPVLSPQDKRRSWCQEAILELSRYRALISYAMGSAEGAVEHRPDILDISTQKTRDWCFVRSVHQMRKYNSALTAEDIFLILRGTKAQNMSYLDQSYRSWAIVNVGQQHYPSEVSQFVMVTCQFQPSWIVVDLLDYTAAEKVLLLDFLGSLEYRSFIHAGAILDDKGQADRFDGDTHRYFSRRFTPGYYELELDKTHEVNSSADLSVIVSSKVRRAFEFDLHDGPHHVPLLVQDDSNFLLPWQGVQPKISIDDDHWFEATGTHKFWIKIEPLLSEAVRDTMRATMLQALRSGLNLSIWCRTIDAKTIQQNAPAFILVGTTPYPSAYGLPVVVFKRVILWNHSTFLGIPYPLFSFGYHKMCDYRHPVYGDMYGTELVPLTQLLRGRYMTAFARSKNMHKYCEKLVLERVYSTETVMWLLQMVLFRFSAETFRPILIDDRATLPLLHFANHVRYKFPVRLPDRFGVSVWDIDKYTVSVSQLKSLSYQVDSNVVMWMFQDVWSLYQFVLAVQSADVNNSDTALFYNALVDMLLAKSVWSLSVDDDEYSAFPTNALARKFVPQDQWVIAMKCAECGALLSCLLERVQHRTVVHKQDCVEVQRLMEDDRDIKYCVLQHKSGQYK